MGGRAAPFFKFCRWRPYEAWGHGAPIVLLPSMAAMDWRDATVGELGAILAVLAGMFATGALFRLLVAARDRRDGRQARCDGVHGKWWLTLGERR